MTLLQYLLVNFNFINAEIIINYVKNIFITLSNKHITHSKYVGV